MTLARVPVVLLCATVLACSQAPRTQLVAVIDSDISVPDGLDEIRVDIVGPGGQLRRSEGALRGHEDLPQTLGIVHNGGPLGPMAITVTGRAAGSDRIQRRATVSFVAGETRVIRLDLLAQCVGVGCASSETCAAGSCRPIEVAPEELERWEGPPPRFDAAVPGDGGLEDGEVGDACVSSEERCNGLDDDCDGATDETFDLMTDVMHCGSCDRACPAEPASAAPVCDGGSCALSCDLGYADCDGRLETGCEASLGSVGTCGSCAIACSGARPMCSGDAAAGFSCVAVCPPATPTACGGSCVDTTLDPSHCGGCAIPCPSAPGASARCVGSSCARACDPGFTDCNGVSADGCESRLIELANCGACGMSCSLPNAMESCASGTCAVVACEGRFGDCDPAPGCETDLGSSSRHCGRCGLSCPSAPANATAACSSGRCVLTCAPGFADCNGMIADGCEASLADTATCGSCGIRCAAPTPLCSSSGGGGYACVSTCAATTCGASCVDTSLSVAHCGRCDNACPGAPNARPVCRGGACALECSPGFADCNGGMDGCETAVATDPASCGACNTACPAPGGTVATCSAGACGQACAPGRGDCNGIATDGCEIDLTSDVAHCGACSTACVPGAFVTGVACSAGACTITNCSGNREDCDGSFGNGCEVDADSDPLNCDGCGNACAPAERCCSTDCRAPPC